MQGFHPVSLTIVIFASIGIQECWAYYRSCITVTKDRLPDASEENHALEDHVFYRLEVAGIYWCARRCLQQNKCQSFNYHMNTAICQLSDATASQFPDDLVPVPDVLYYDRSLIPTVSHTHINF